MNDIEWYRETVRIPDPRSFTPAEARHLAKIRRGHMVRVLGLDEPQLVVHRQGEAAWVEPVRGGPADEVSLDQITHVRTVRR